MAIVPDLSVIGPFDAQGELLPPSDYCVLYKCRACAHEQAAWAVNCTFEVIDGEKTLVECWTGSASEYCDACDGSSLEELGWDLASNHGLS